MRKQRPSAAEARAEDYSVPTIRAARLYGVGHDSWREQHKHIFKSDASLRWFVDSNRAELQRAGALAMFRGRLFGVEPQFSSVALRLAREAVDAKAAHLNRSAQEVADEFLGLAAENDPTDDDGHVEAVRRALSHESRAPRN